MTASPGNESILLIADSESDADMLYATGLFVPDPFTFLQVDGQSIIMMSDLEIDRARTQSRADEVVSLTDYTDRARENGNADPGLVDAVVELLRERDAQDVRVPIRFPIGYADRLRERGVKLQSREDPFWEQRPIKTDDEVAAISNASRHTEDALRMAFGILSEASVKDGVLHGPDGPLTSEYLRKRIHVYLLERDCIAQHTIIAGGVQGCDPHNGGSGPLRAGEPIISTCFPSPRRPATSPTSPGPWPGARLPMISEGCTISCWKDRKSRSHAFGPGWTVRRSTGKWNGCSNPGVSRRA